MYGVQPPNTLNPLLPPWMLLKRKDLFLKTAFLSKFSILPKGYWTHNIFMLVLVLLHAPQHYTPPAGRVASIILLIKSTLRLGSGQDCEITKLIWWEFLFIQ